MYSFHITHQDDEAGSAGRSMIRPTPIYHQRQTGLKVDDKLALDGVFAMLQPTPIYHRQQATAESDDEPDLEDSTLLRPTHQSQICQIPVDRLALARGMLKPTPIHHWEQETSDSEDESDFDEEVTLLQPTPIYHREQVTSDSDGEFDFEDFPMRFSDDGVYSVTPTFWHYRDEMAVRRRVERTMELSVDMYSPTIEGRNCDWALIFHDPFFGKAFRFRMAGGPRIGEPWRFDFECGWPNPFPTPAKRYFITTMPERQCHRIHAAARRTHGRFCQQWVVDALRDLESQSLVPPGKASELYQFLEMDQYPDVQPSYNDQLTRIEQERALPLSERMLLWTFGQRHREVSIFGRLHGRFVEGMLRLGLDLEVQILINHRSDQTEAMWVKWRTILFDG
ncbi:unnamed protein product [Fusarium graminearum]|nr:unnamed protein product [Fusarium graminearum]